jgi:ribonuclease G
VTRRLILAVSPGEIWGALEEAGEFVELRLARGGARGLLGEIYLGRVVALRPELPAALVDIGLARPGFLSAEDAVPGRGIAALGEGDAVIVEIVKEARADKSAGLSLRPRAGLLWEEARAAAKEQRPPARLAALSPVAMLIEQFGAPAFDAIVIDDRGALAEARRWLAQHHPELADRLAFGAEAEAIAAAIEEALAPRVPLAGGGALVIEPTAAAVMIDVDSGAAPQDAVNLAAAQAAARHIRLRNLAGPIVIDFIPTRRRGARERIRAVLAAALAADSARPDVLGWTRLGHLEIVRPRRQAPLHEILFEHAPGAGRAKTAATVAYEALGAAARMADATAGRALALAVHPEVAAMLEEGEAGEARRALEGRLGRPLAVVAEPARPREAFDIRPL